MSETIPEPVAAESRMVSVPGGRLNVRDFPGVEPALVVMHGFPDDSRIYDRLAPLLAPHQPEIVAQLIKQAASTELRRRQARVPPPAGVRVKSEGGPTADVVSRYRR